jgi:hypothetical protein
MLCTSPRAAVLMALMDPNDGIYGAVHLNTATFVLAIIGRTILLAFLIPLVKMLYLVIGTTPQDRILIAQKLTEL